MSVGSDRGGSSSSTEPVAIVVAVAEDPVGRLPQPLLRSVRGRLDELSQRARNMLQVAAVLGGGFAPRDLAEMLGELPVQLLGPLQEAMDAGLLSSDSEGFVFHREPVWRAVLGTVPAPLRSMLHQQAATMLLARAGEPTVGAAVHLVHWRSGAVVSRDGADGCAESQSSQLGRGGHHEADGPGAAVLSALWANPKARADGPHVRPKCPLFHAR